MLYYTYVLQSKKDKFFYIGFTTTLKKRITDHQAGKVFSTKSRRPVQLMYFEVCRNEKDARAREKYLKTGMGHRYIRNRNQHFLETLTGEIP